MRRMLFALLSATCAVPALAQGAPPPAKANQPNTIEYYYKVHWCRHQEYLSRIVRNHHPLLKKTGESGRKSIVRIESPASHTPEGSRWDDPVTIQFPNSTLATRAIPDEEPPIQQLDSEQKTCKREEQRRSEILVSHGHLTVSRITPAN